MFETLYFQLEKENSYCFLNYLSLFLDIISKFDLANLLAIPYFSVSLSSNALFWVGDRGLLPDY